MTTTLPGMGPTISKAEIASSGDDEVFVTVTPRAVTKAQSLLADKGFSDAFLRVFVVAVPSCYQGYSGVFLVAGLLYLSWWLFLAVLF